MSLAVSAIVWEPSWRVIPTRYSEERVLRKLAEKDDLKAISELEEMTNERLRQERGEAAIVAPREEATGPGSDLIMAPFTYRNPDGSRFSDGHHGVYYAAKTLETAIEETKHHRQAFMAATGEGPMRLEMRVLAADLDAELHDLRGRQKKLAAVYSKTSYAAAQELAARLLVEGSSGVVYDSVRHKGGQCAAVFKPSALSRCRRDRTLVHEWDGRKIAKVYELNER